MEKIATRARAGLAAAALAGLLAAAGASAEPDSCREWKAEHAQWMTESARLYLTGAPQGELDAAVFELLQREAYLTSCDVTADSARTERVGWRLVGRHPDEYGSAVLEALLDGAGFDSGLRSLFEGTPAPVVAARSGRAVRGRPGAR